MKSLKVRLPLGTVRGLLALSCGLLLVPGDSIEYAQASTQGTAPQEQATPKIPNDQLDSLVSPIALYPDPLLAEVLAASTYPLEIVQLQQWMAQHKDLKDKALVDAVQKQDWDPSVQALAVLPDVVKRLADDIKWTTDLGNAFLVQQSDVMDAVQRMRAKAQQKGNLKSNEQMTIETKTVESKQVIVIEQSNPQVVYVPSYDPVVVYGPPAYPYPPVYYPPPGYAAAGMAISFGVGMMVGAAISGGWGWGCGWGNTNNINININNTFIHYSDRLYADRGTGTGGGNNWQHNPQHRGGTPYSNKATANKYGGTARGDSMATRQAGARQSQGQIGGRQQPTTMDRGGGGADRVGNRSVSNGGGSRGSGGFGGSSRGYSGDSARTSSSRGRSSMGGGGRSGGRHR